MTRSTFLGANTGPLYPELGTARCFCCSIICDPAADGRCARCVERNAWPCPDCNVHVDANERHEGGRCEECAASAERAA